jgi:hypothetical protein
MVCKKQNFNIKSFFCFIVCIVAEVALRYFTGFSNYDAANKLQNGGWPGLVERMRWAYAPSCNENSFHGYELVLVVSC